MKTIVLINGVARSGKDTFAEMLVPYLCEDKKGFILPNAFGVKEVASRVYGWDGDKDERGRSLLIDITNIGINNEIIWPACSCNLPSLKSTPRDAWAFNILFVSLNKVGIDLKAIEIIIANILVLIFINSSGFNSHSIALVISVGLVVNVIVVEASIITNTLPTKKLPWTNPSLYMSKYIVLKTVPYIGNLKK